VALAEREFQANHCIRYVRTESRNGAAAHRLEFRPKRTVTEPDVAGVVWLNFANLQLVADSIWITGLDPRRGRVREAFASRRYRRLDDGTLLADYVRLGACKSPHGNCCGSGRLTTCESFRQRLSNGDPYRTCDRAWEGLSLLKCSWHFRQRARAVWPLAKHQQLRPRRKHDVAR
jgi:hypothetical protein